MNRETEIINIIEKNPGIKFREIMRETGLKNGVLSYHTRKLEENGSVKIDRKSGETRFYPLFVTEEESILITSLRRDTQRYIVLALLEDRPLSFNEIVQKAKKAPSTVSIFLSKLVDDKIVDIRTMELKKTYLLRNVDMVHEIIEKYNPILLERTAYNFADTFSSL
ncbi:winged helix-turn-helix transcriptional regulator [Candidatus Nitrosotalea okcheonensis]|uniref:Transcriptional regulator, ArsR family n=1 Tax=Candidatus Nitrosotalea okcheonensis TaxID=1903276 RepID=A0A2H1FCI8_9ARCH|nr:winged helix-turn-helix transcriptional regulator [Candidatus Nitrosotalea okcheonensis]MDE1728327.1 winged helix-turn-helix transcriptional regulator [Nitrososphaerota archaeon]MDE1832123.1 winged helix-turn-helix transcriptional regulator [Nitrososphaerota archaeon]SMH70482.1 Transcriptional regulator, ArsR family [Candidatus Nitrosotalea okcheonensis]